MRNLILFIIGSLLLAGCASLDVAKKALKNGDVKTSKRIYEEWARRGFGFANLKIAKISDNKSIKIKNALTVYKKGYTQAANLLFYEYYLLRKTDKAKIWFKKVVFDKMNYSQYKAYVTFIFYFINNKKTYLDKFANFAKSTGNMFALYSLGEYYSKYKKDYKTGLYFYQLASKRHYVFATISMALLYIYQLDKQKLGINLLQNVADKDNGLSAFEIAKFLEKQLNIVIKHLNSPCITFSFTKPRDFLQRKIKILKFRNLYLKHNVVPWLNYSYKRGYIKAKFELISLDLRYGSFITHNTFSKMNLKQSITFLEMSNYMQAKLILAKIFELYPSMHMINRAEQIYNEYANINKIAGYWRLYQLYKRYYPNSPKKMYYLKYLVNNNFQPAIIEYAYIMSDFNTLRFYAEQNNILALTYLASLYSKEDKKLTCKYLKKLCSLTVPINGKLDIKIARNCLNDIDKKGAIYYFYANRGYSKAQFLISELYKKQNECSKFLFWLNKAKREGYMKAEILYYELVLQGKIKGDHFKALKILSTYAQNNPSIYIFLGNIYSSGIYQSFKPKKAIYFYTLAIKKGLNSGYLKLINFYIKIDDAKVMFKKINSLYKQFLEINNSKKAKLSYAQFLFSYKKYVLVKKYILDNFLQTYSTARFILFKIDPDYYKFNENEINLRDDGRLILVYAKKIFDSDKKKALYYTFIASFKKTPGSTDYIIKLLRFFRKKEATKIYFKAKKDYLNIVSFAKEN